MDRFSDTQATTSTNFVKIGRMISDKTIQQVFQFLFLEFDPLVKLAFCRFVFGNVGFRVSLERVEFTTMFLFSI
jgi:hypothetical protein